jgi:molybdopterin synthase sulfur carrier subunit
MRVLLFGRLADLAGWREREIEPAPASVAALRARLAADDAALGAALDGAGVQVAVDRAIIRGAAALGGVDEVAFLPPMSGG